MGFTSEQINFGLLGRNAAVYGFIALHYLGPFRYSWQPNSCSCFVWVMCNVYMNWNVFFWITFSIEGIRKVIGRKTCAHLVAICAMVNWQCWFKFWAAVRCLQMCVTGALGLEFAHRVQAVLQVHLKERSNKVLDICFHKGRAGSNLAE